MDVDCSPSKDRSLESRAVHQPGRAESRSVGYGCYNREPYRSVFKARDGKKEVFVEFRMTHDCQYTKTELGQKDQKCCGCLWKAKDSV
jgi:hypothetical protein